MTKEQITHELSQDGYRPFLQTVVGSVIQAETWVHSPGHRPVVILLCRKDTGEMVDVNNLPEDEDRETDVLAFLDDFRERVFQPQ